MHVLSASDLFALLAAPRGTEELSALTGLPLVVVPAEPPPDEATRSAWREALSWARTVPAVVVVTLPSGTGPVAEELVEVADVLLADDPAADAEVRGAVVPEGGLDAGLDRLTAAVEANPLAAAAMAVLLRWSERRTVLEGLAAESAVYSTLQSGPEFARWRASWTPRERPPEPGPVVLVNRDGGELHITFNRPHVHNAFSVRLRDELVEALEVALVDPTVERVVLDGNGPSFCSGGDLAEFGTFPDPGVAHVVRMTRSPARLVSVLAARLGERFEVRVHGSCLGAGVELPSFAARVVAHPGARFGLPELGLGLVPGAGGTASLPRRIGRHRSAYLGLSGDRIDAGTALRWQLVDEVDPNLDFGA